MCVFRWGGGATEIILHYINNYGLRYYSQYCLAPRNDILLTLRCRFTIKRFTVKALGKTIYFVMESTGHLRSSNHFNVSATD